MNFKEAEAKLAEIAGGRYRSLRYEKVIDQFGHITTICTIYVDGQNHTSAPTWGRVFQTYVDKMKPLPVEEVPEDEAMEETE